MAINRVDFPTTPNPVAGDWALINTLMSKAFQNVNNPLQVDGSNIPQGSTFQIGGVVYYADSDTAITGTASDYVKITTAGVTATASFVADLTGVTWNKIYNGYYDVSDNLYVFDEVKAIVVGDLATLNTKFSFLANPTFDNLVVSSLIVESSSIETLNSGTSWIVPAYIYRVKAIIIGAGGGGAGAKGTTPYGAAGSAGGATIFNSVSSAGGLGGSYGILLNGRSGTDGLASGNGGNGGSSSSVGAGDGTGGQIKVQIFTVTPSSSITYTIGSGGSGGVSDANGGDGGDGQIILLY